QNQLAARLTQLLRRRQGGWKYHRRGMQHRTVVQVILLHQMRTGGVDQGSKLGRAALATDQYLAGAVTRAHTAGVTLKQRNRMAALTGQRRAQPVKKQLFSTSDHRVGQIVVPQSSEEASKCLGLVHACPLRSYAAARADARPRRTGSSWWKSAPPGTGGFRGTCARRRIHWRSQNRRGSAG